MRRVPKLLLIVAACLVAITAMVLVATAVTTPRDAPSQSAKTPRDVPGLKVRKQTQITDPVALAARLFRQAATDAFPQGGSGGSFALSPDGKQVAFTFQYYSRTVPGNEPHIRIQDLQTGAQRAWDVAAWKGKRRGYDSVGWSLDGRRLIFASQGPDPGDKTPSAVWSCALSGADLRRLTSPSISASSPRLSPDGRRLAFVKSRPQAPSELCVLDMATKKHRTLLSDGGYGQAAWSPDGKQLAYVWSGAHVPSRFEVVSVMGKERRRITSVAEMRQGGITLDATARPLLWLPDQKSLLGTFQHNRPPMHHVWEVRLDGTTRHLAQGEALAQTPKAHKLLLKLNEKYWLVELASPITRATATPEQRPRRSEERNAGRDANLAGVLIGSL